MTVPNETDVKVDSSPTEAVNTETQPTQTEQVIETPVQGDEPQVVNASELSALDEQVVQTDNREAEWKRKYEQLADRFPEYIDQAVQEAAKTFQSVAQKQQEPTYTPEQLRMVIHDDSGTYSAANKVWAEQELERLNEQKLSKLLEEKLNLSQRSQKEQQIKAESEAYVVKTFPDMFNKDVNGNIVGWNNEHPMTQLTAKYLKQLGNKPGAIRDAARQAFVDYQLSAKTTSDKKAKLAQSEVAQLKRQQVSTSGGSAEINTLSQQVNEAFNKFKSTGNVRDAQAYNMLKGKLSALQLKGK